MQYGIPKPGYSDLMNIANPNRLCIRLITVGYLTLAGLVIGQETSPRSEPPDSQAAVPALLNPRLAAIHDQLKAGQSNALTLFWQEVRTNCPMVEYLRRDERRITYLWRGDAATKRVALLGGMPSGYLSTPMDHMSGSDIW